jgi:pilus assembly protein CpaE
MSDAMRPPHESPQPLAFLSKSQPVRAIAFLRSDTTREDLSRRLREIPDLSFDIVTGRDVTSVDADIAFVEIDISNPEDLAFIGEVRAISGVVHTDIVAITNAATPQDVLRAVRAGAEDVLVRPIDTREIRDVVGRLSARRAKVMTDHAPRAHLMTFAHASGGAGATTLAVNAALALAQRCDRGDVCLLDLDIQFGSAASQLDLPPASPISDLIKDPDRLDRDMLEGMMTRHESGLLILTSPRLPLPLDALNGGIVSRILETAQRHHRFVVVDLPHALTPWSDTVLRRSNIIYLITQMGVPAVHQLKKFYDLLLEEHLDDLPIHLVVNRHQGALGKAADISTGQIQRVVGRTVNHYIPNDYGMVMTALNQGKPVMIQNRSSKIAQGIREMLEAMTGPDFFEEKRPVGLGALSQKLFGG